MENVNLQLNETGQGSFLVSEDGKQLGEMVVGVSGKNLTAYHTEVSPESEGRGLAKKLLTAMVDYTRKNGLKVTALCPYVHAQFKRHPDEYADVWNRNGE